MNERLGILHLSDIHASTKSKTVLHHLVEQLKRDIQAVQKERNVKIQMVCISGDLINSGDNADEELDIVLEELIQPLLELLSLDEKRVFVVAGNHEVKRSSIVPYIENGLCSTLVSEAAIEDFLHSIDDESIKRISYFDTDFAELFGNTPVWTHPLGRAYMIDTGSLKVGISCLNSAWRSTGVGETEKRKMVLGRKLIIDSYESIKEADIKICIAHHPFDWLIDEDKTAVEKCISQYDIVLSGHIHESDAKILTSFNGQTLFNTCGKFDNSSDIYNGYSILGINPYNKDCDVILRQYFDFPRGCFDKALPVAEEGIFSASLGKKDDTLALAYNVVHSIEDKFLEYANSYFVSNVAAGKVMKSFDESFIIPEFKKYSEYEKETKQDHESSDDEEIITLEDICRGKQNLLLLGKKESGKTTVLHYITKYDLANFNSLMTVPVIVNTLHVDYAGKNVITRAIHKYINQYCDESSSFSVADIEKLLKAGLCTIMFDDFEMAENREVKKINEFIDAYPNNRFIFSEKENITSKYFHTVEVIPACEYETARIASLTKGQIRAIATRSFSSEDSSALVDKIMLCFKKTTLPKTPFVLSLILSICDTADFAPINEAVIMEQFIEHLLEKASPTEAYSTTYDFHIKEDFLINLAAYMDKNNKFFLYTNEFEDFLNAYHADKGFPLKETNFDSLFFNKGVLIRTDLIVAFRYNCMVEYYLAKKAMQSPEFLDHILDKRTYLNYPNELLYYTGLNRKDVRVVEVLQKALYADYDVLRDVVPKIDDYNIGIDISLPEESFVEKIGESKLTQTQSDKIRDTEDVSEKRAPAEIDKSVTHEKMDAFIHTLLIYGSCLKNLELLSKQQKETMYNDYNLGLCIMLGIFKKSAEDFFNEEVSEMKQFPDQYSDEDIEEIKTLMQDMLKISLPIALQNIALENIGTIKLKSIIEGVIKDKNSSDFARFFSVFLFSDLHLPGLRGVLEEYIAGITNKSLLTIVFFKLLYYYRFRYFSPSLDSFFENILADINIKLYGKNKKQKDRVISEFKKQKLLNNA